jgi:hypothetical protein
MGVIIGLFLVITASVIGAIRLGEDVRTNRI